MSLFQPRSVLQLVLAGFTAALVPLCVAILFTLYTFDELADKTRANSSLLVEVTRLGQEIEGDMVELERRAGQYYALLDPELAELFSRERALLLEKLGNLQGRIQLQGRELQQLMDSVDKLALEPPESAVRSGDTPELSPGERLMRAFEPVSRQGGRLESALQAYVDDQLQSNASEAQDLIDELVLQLVFYAGATLALLLVISYWITRPVRQLTQEIHQLGTKGLGHSIDISGPEELRQLGSKLEWLRQELREAEQREQRFFRHMSHEFKTPLASLREGADLLSEQVAGPLSGHQQEVINIIRHNSIELQRLIENLIDYNQMPLQTTSFEEISLGELWDEVLGHYLISLEGKSLQLDARREVDSWVADRYKLRTALDNLLSNAVNYTPKGGTIELVWEQRDGNLVIEMANSGDPIPEENAEKVFEPFFQGSAKRSGPIKGSGIGLSVARECMESQGGNLDLVPHPDLPICFRLVCPAH